MPASLGGPTWDTAGEVTLGYQSVPTPVTDSADVFYWKFTPAVSEKLFFDARDSHWLPDAGSDPLATADVRIYVYTGADEGSATLEHTFWDTVRADGSSTVGFGVMDVIAGTEYHLVVEGGFGVRRIVLGVSQPVVGDWVQDPDITTQAETNSGPAGWEYEGSYTLYPDFTPGTRSVSQLQDDMNAAMDGVAFTHVGTSGGAQAGRTGGARVYHLPPFGEGPYHNAAGNGYTWGYGFNFGDRGDPYAWTKYDYEWAPGTGDIEYDNGGLTTYVKTILEANPFVLTQVYGATYDDLPPNLTSSCDFRLSPSPEHGTGRLIHTSSVSGPAPGVYDEAAYADTTDLFTVELIPDDYANADRTVYVVAQPVIKATWEGLVTGTSPDYDVEADITFGLRDKDNYGNPYRYDTHTPPRYRYLTAGPCIPALSVPPARLLYPRTDDLGIGIGRIYPPPNTQQYGRRFGSGAPI